MDRPGVTGFSPPTTIDEPKRVFHAENRMPGAHTQRSLLSYTNACEAAGYGDDESRDRRSLPSRTGTPSGIRLLLAKSYRPNCGVVPVESCYTNPSSEVSRHPM